MISTGKKGCGACTTARQAQTTVGALSLVVRHLIPSIRPCAEPPLAGAGQARVRARSAALAVGEEGKEEGGRGSSSTARSSGRRRYVWF